MYKFTRRRGEGGGSRVFSLICTQGRELNGAGGLFPF